MYDAQIVKEHLYSGLNGLEISRSTRANEKRKEREEPLFERAGAITRAGVGAGVGTGGKSGNALALECAILEGKVTHILTYTLSHSDILLSFQLGNHAVALSTLVHELRDSASAEAYCTLGGEVVPAKQALGIVESMGGPETSSRSVEGLSLKEWYFGLFEPMASTRTKKSAVFDAAGAGVEAPAMVRQKSVKEEVKNALLRDLVGVYMSDA